MCKKLKVKKEFFLQRFKQQKTTFKYNKVVICLSKFEKIVFIAKKCIIFCVIEELIFTLFHKAVFGDFFAHLLTTVEAA